MKIKTTNETDTGVNDPRQNLNYRGELPELSDSDKQEMDKIRQDVLSQNIYDNTDYHVTDTYDDTV